jgi:hypothetical protein
MYQSGMTLDAVAKHFKCCPWVVRAELKKRGVQRRKTGTGCRVFTQDEKDTAREMYEARVSQDAIAAHLKCAQCSVSRILRGMGVKMRHGQRGSDNPYWKGGEIEANGYAQTLVSADDPMASMRTPAGYVLTHRLRVARKLGRPLTKTETVHHIDGNPLNNDPSNLQLRQGRHGKGACVRCLDCGSVNISHVPIAEPQPAQAAN